MSYPRVIPRDLFNEANLLKCYGTLWLAMESVPNVTFEQTNSGPFEIEQNVSGDLSIANIQLVINNNNQLELYRPLNSREPYPLYLTDFEDIDISVFDNSGKLSREFLELISSENSVDETITARLQKMLHEGWRDEEKLASNEDIRRAREYLSTLGYHETSPPKSKEVIFDHPCGYKVIIYTHRNYVRHVPNKEGIIVKNYPKIVKIDYIKNDKTYYPASFKDIKKPRVRVKALSEPSIDELLSEDVINELSIADRLGYMVKTGIQNVGNRASASLGSSKARGKLDLSAGVAELYKKWREYVGRKEAIGNRTIEDKPTLVDLADFLKTTYNISIPIEALNRVANAVKPTQRDTPQNTTRDTPQKTTPHKRNLMQRALGTNKNPNTKNSTTEEFSFFNNMFGGNHLLEDENDTVFDPRTLFPKIADWMISKGIMTFDREGATTNSNNQGGPVGRPRGSKNKNKMGSDVIAVDANKMKYYLEQFSISPENLDIIRKKEPKVLAANLNKAVVFETVPALIYSLSNSWATRIDPTKNVTASGNTIDMEILLSELETCLDGNFKPINVIARYSKGDKDEAVKKIQEVMKSDSKDALMFCQLAHAVAKAITKG